MYKNELLAWIEGKTYFNTKQVRERNLSFGWNKGSIYSNKI